MRGKMNKDNEVVLEQILEQSLAGYWDCDIPSGEAYMSLKFKKMFGYEDHEIKNTVDSWKMLIFEEDLPSVVDKFKQHVESKGEIPFNVDIRYHHKSGSTVWLNCTGNVIEWDDEGNAKRIVGCHIDITGRKLAEELQRENRDGYTNDIIEHKSIEQQREQGFALLTNLARLVPGVIYQYRLYPDGRSAFPYASPGMVDIYAVTPEEVREDATPVFGRLHPDDYDRVAEDIFRSARTLETFYCDFRVILPGKGLCWRWSKAYPERTADGGTLWHGIIMDVTERKLIEEAIAAEKEQLSVTLRSIGDGVITTDTLGNVVIMNKVAEVLCGWRQSEAHGKPLASVFNTVNENTREPLGNPAEKVLSTGHIIELAEHTLLIARDGTERIIADSGAPIKDKESKTIGVVLVFRDMTEKQKILDNLQRIDKLNSLGVLAGGIAHDFNNLLAGIFGYIDMAKEQTANDVTATKYLDKTLAVFERAKDLTQQLLTFSKGGAPKRKTGQIGKLVKENASFVLSGSNVNYEYKIPYDLWLCDYDENQIGQVFDNIVLNAQQAMPFGGTIMITVSNVSIESSDTLQLKSGNYIKVSVADTGVGIPQELLKRIFDPFFTTKQKGNGLGLATSYSIIEKHGGCIDVESVPGKGSTFHIYLPATQKGIVQDISQTTQQHQGKGSIIVMDDEDYMREIVGRMLVSMGYTFIETENGNDALRICDEILSQGNTIIAALFDLTIPGGMGGKETIFKFRERFPDIPVFASSGYSEDPVMAKPCEFGFTDSIRKPFKKGELAEMLNKHLNHVTNKN
jgi:PAS domain S-box-containing protein